MPLAKRLVPAPKKIVGCSLELKAAAREALCRHFKDHSRAILHGGGEYAIDLVVSGAVNGLAFSDTCQGQLHVGEDYETSASSGPDAAELLAAVLAKLSKGRREAFLAEITAEYAASGKLPEAPKLIADQAAAALKAMRSSATVSKKGTVKFSATKPVLAV